MLRLMYGYPERELRKEYFEEIASLAKSGKRVLLIVPEQQVLAYEDEAMKSLPEDAALSFTVASFSILAETAERICGGLSYKLLSKPIKALYMWKAIREMRPFLSMYKGVSPEKLSSLMTECIDDLKTSGITPEEIDDAIPFLSDSEALSSKLRDISMIYSAYAALVGNKFTDQNDSLMKLVGILKKQNIFKDACFFIDSFTDFTPLQMSVLKRLIPGSELTVISLPTQSRSDTSIQFESVRTTERELMRLCEDFILDMEISEYRHDTNTTPIEYVKNNLWRITKEPIPEEYLESAKNDIEIYSAKDRHEEVYAAINLVKKSLYNGGRLSDIAVIARDPSQYKKLFVSAARDAGIPIFTSDRTPLSHKVYVNYILSLLHIIAFGWQREDVMAHLKCGLSPLDENDIRRYELYTARWKLSGKKQLAETSIRASYTRFSKRAEEDDEYTISVDRVRKELLLPISELESRLKKAKSIRDLLSLLYEYLEERNVRQHLTELAESLSNYGDTEEADQTARVYSAVVMLFDDISYAAGDDAAVSVREFASLLEMLFSLTDLGSIPARQDELVLADASLYRSFGHKTVILLGCRSGEFPASVKKSGVITRAEKERLENEGLRFAANAYEAASREYMYFWRSVGLAENKLIIMYPEKTGGESDAPRSPAVDKILSLVPSLSVKRIENVLPDIMYDLSSSMTMLSVYAPKSRLYGEIASVMKEQSSLTDRLTDREASLTSSHTVGRESAEKFIGEPLYMSPTALESYNKCAYAYFCEKLLKLDSGEKNEFNYAVSGDIIHAALEGYLSSRNASTLSAEEIKTVCKDAVEAYYEEICPEHLRGNERLKVAFRRAAVSAAILAMYVGADLEKTSFTPKLFEYSTSSSGGLKIEGEHSAVISGRIDRIDSAVKEDGEYLRIIDYKSGSKVFSLDEMREGKELQLPIYLKSLLTDEEKKPGGFLYISSNPSTETITSVEELGDITKTYAKILSGIKQSGILNAAFANGQKESAALMIYQKEELERTLEEAEKVIENTVSSIFEGNFPPATPASENDSPCQYCRFGAICRQKKKTRKH